MEEIVLSLIMHSGEARSKCMEAIHLAKIGEFEKARKFLEKADEELGYAHNSQTTLIQGESAFKKIVRQNKNINSEVNKFMVLDWTLRIYKDIVKYQR